MARIFSRSSERARASTVYSRTFTDEANALLAHALRAIKWHHRARIMSSGLLLASSPLTADEARVLHGLLTRASEREIADQLQLAPSTVHRHVTAIFRKFGVRSRAALMSLWIGKAGGPERGTLNRERRLHASQRRA